MFLIVKTIREIPIDHEVQPTEAAVNLAEKLNQYSKARDDAYFIRHINNAGKVVCDHGLSRCELWHEVGNWKAAIQFANELHKPGWLPVASSLDGELAG